MTILKATEARTRLYNLIDEAAETHQPIVITGKRNNAVLISESDWNAINEHCIYCQSPACDRLFERAWNPIYPNALRKWTGELENLLHQTNSERCKEN